mgnify:CR=1 FL=1
MMKASTSIAVDLEMEGEFMLLQQAIAIFLEKRTRNLVLFLILLLILSCLYSVFH